MNFCKANEAVLTGEGATEENKENANGDGKADDAVEQAVDGMSALNINVKESQGMHAAVMAGLLSSALPHRGNWLWSVKLRSKLRSVSYTVHALLAHIQIVFPGLVFVLVYSALLARYIRRIPSNGH